MRDPWFTTLATPLIDCSSLLPHFTSQFRPAECLYVNANISHVWPRIFQFHLWYRCSYIFSWIWYNTIITKVERNFLSIPYYLEHRRYLSILCVWHDIYFIVCTLFAASCIDLVIDFIVFTSSTASCIDDRPKRLICLVGLATTHWGEATSVDSTSPLSDWFCLIELGLGIQHVAHVFFFWSDCHSALQWGKVWPLHWGEASGFRPPLLTQHLLCLIDFIVKSYLLI